jgi:hypothetical protein
MKNGTYPLEQILRDVAATCRASGDDSATTIGSAIHEALDYWSRAGFKVNFDYAQERAIARVKKLIREL